jgi:hypothetical protein
MCFSIALRVHVLQTVVPDSMPARADMQMKEIKTGEELYVRATHVTKDMEKYAGIVCETTESDCTMGTLTPANRFGSRKDVPPATRCAQLKFQSFDALVVCTFVTARLWCKPCVSLLPLSWTMIMTVMNVFDLLCRYKIPGEVINRAVVASPQKMSRMLEARKNMAQKRLRLGNGVKMFAGDDAGVVGSQQSTQCRDEDV